MYLSKSRYWPSSSSILVENTVKSEQCKLMEYASNMELEPRSLGRYTVEKMIAELHGALGLTLITLNRITGYLN